MAELTNQFCESTGSAEITLSQYGRYLGDAEKPPLPFLNERTVVSYFTGEPGTLKLGNTIYSIEPGMVIVLFPGVCINATAMAGAKIDAHGGMIIKPGDIYYWVRPRLICLLKSAH